MQGITNKVHVIQLAPESNSLRVPIFCTSSARANFPENLKFRIELKSPVMVIAKVLPFAFFSYTEEPALNFSYTVELVLKEHPISHKNVSQDRWSLVTGLSAGTAWNTGV